MNAETKTRADRKSRNSGVGGPDSGSRVLFHGDYMSFETNRLRFTFAPSNVRRFRRTRQITQFQRPKCRAGCDLNAWIQSLANICTALVLADLSRSGSEYFPEVEAELGHSANLRRLAHGKHRAWNSLSHIVTDK